MTLNNKVQHMYLVAFLGESENTQFMGVMRRLRARKGVLDEVGFCVGPTDSQSFTAAVCPQ